MADDAVDARLPLPVAPDTVVHVQSSHLSYLLRSFNGTVASLTSKTGPNVWPVLEVNIIGHGGNFDPLDGLPALPVTSQFLHFWITGGGDFVAPHAALSRRNTRYGGPPGINVAVLTGDMVIAGMNFMVEGDRLYRR